MYISIDSEHNSLVIIKRRKCSIEKYLANVVITTFGSLVMFWPIMSIFLLVLQYYSIRLNQHHLPLAMLLFCLDYYHRLCVDHYILWWNRRWEQFFRVWFLEPHFLVLCHYYLWSLGLKHELHFQYLFQITFVALGFTDAPAPAAKYFFWCWWFWCQFWILGVCWWDRRIQIRPGANRVPIMPSCNKYWKW